MNAWRRLASGLRRWRLGRIRSRRAPARRARRARRTRQEVAPRSSAIPCPYHELRARTRAHQSRRRDHAQTYPTAASTPSFGAAAPTAAYPQRGLETRRGRPIVPRRRSHARFSRRRSKLPGRGGDVPNAVLRLLRRRRAVSEAQGGPGHGGRRLGKGRMPALAAGNDGHADTVPQIFINGRSVRGYDDIIELDRQGGLEPLLREPASEPSRVPGPCQGRADLAAQRGPRRLSRPCRARPGRPSTDRSRRPRCRQCGR